MLVFRKLSHRVYETSIIGFDTAHYTNNNVFVSNFFQNDMSIYNIIYLNNRKVFSTFFSDIQLSS